MPYPSGYNKSTLFWYYPYGSNNKFLTSSESPIVFPKGSTINIDNVTYTLTYCQMQGFTIPVNSDFYISITGLDLSQSNFDNGYTLYGKKQGNAPIFEWGGVKGKIVCEGYYFEPLNVRYSNGCTIYHYKNTLSKDITEIHFYSGIEGSHRGLSFKLGLIGNDSVDSIIRAIEQQTDDLLKGNGSQITEDIINGAVDKINQKLGVLTFGEQVLKDFFNLFEPNDNTSLIFPGFTIKVANQDYKVWDDITYDLKEVENNFSFLISTLRTMLVVLVYLALLKYAVDTFERIFNK